MTVVMETYREGIAVGEKLGEKRGAIWGRKEGIDLGRNEAMKAIISLMQQNGFGMEDICKNTGLSEEEVVKLMVAKKE